MNILPQPSGFKNKLYRNQHEADNKQMKFQGGGITLNRRDTNQTISIGSLWERECINNKLEKSRLDPDMGERSLKCA
jgi:hypothetical protein